ncbi:TIGR04086 family membrane protein [Faecalicatena acetigenes]|uniref:TIGR04086 family membrane protein n=1 Tax=Faecalicatena acetigenes TaxID=2981790 RepID=A0ABT2TBB4_9FIRM|nr:MULTISPECIES: TIGR04086 family membrane protein [Lachnospiraceae]MCU6747276.1 TIGR04086 family membrane protein [Faecalicatena acetigenes]RGT72059.1 TIGR04086 family membrane protein [Ruminococcus sp. AF18-22]SCH77407.1 putative membrane protein [uncultured Clostridium sp.]
MEKNTKNSRSVETKLLWLLKSLLCAYVVTGILLFILTLLLYKLDLDEGKVTAGIVGIYILSTFAGGFMIGKLAGVRKFIWGMLAGVFYFVLLLLISLGVYHTLQSEWQNMLTTCLLCAGGGMLGGMLS